MGYIGTNIRVQHLILSTAGIKPTIPSPVTIDPSDSRWKATDILKGEWAHNIEDDIWYYRTKDDTIKSISVSDVGGVQNRYTTVVQLIGDQSNQTNKSLQFVSNASGDSEVIQGWAYYEYLGTTNGNLTDYRVVSKQHYTLYKTASQWTSDNTVVPDRTIGYETDTNKFKFGDGVTAWNSLAYANEALVNSTKAHSTTVVADKFYFIRGSNRLTTSGNVAYTLSSTGAKIGGGYYIEVVAGGNHVLSFTPDPYEYKIDGATGVTVDTENGDLTLTSGNKYTVAIIWQGSESGWAVIVVDAYFTTGDVTAPTIGTFDIPDANPDRINFVSSEVITASTFGGFTISTGQTITGITINAGQTTGHYFTVDSAFDEADGTPTIAYSGTGCDIQDNNSNALASFTATNITNSVVDPPSFVSAEVGAVADDILRVVYSKAVNATTAGHNIDTDGAALSISSISAGSGTTTVDYQLSRSILDSETLNYDYDQGTGNTLAVANSKELNTATDESVTNNVAGSFHPNDLSPDYFDETLRTFTGSNFVDTLIDNTPFRQTFWHAVVKVTPDDGNPASIQIVFGMKNTSDDARINLQIRTDGSVWFSPNNSISYASSSPVFSDGAGQEKVLRISNDNSVVKLFVDGVDTPISPTTPATDNISTSNLYYGAYNNDGSDTNHFTGTSKGIFIKGGSSNLTAQNLSDLDSYFAAL